MNRLSIPVLILTLLGLAGCASTDKMDARLTELDQQLASLKSEQQKLSTQYAALNSAGTDSKALAEQALERATDAASITAAGDVHVSDLLARQQASIDKLVATVDAQGKASAQALETSQDAIKIARDSRAVVGKVVEEVVLGEDMVPYGFEVPDLLPPGRAALDRLIAEVKGQLPYIFIEITGHSDDVATGEFNLRVAQGRAEAVRRYLHEAGGFPLHRMSVISYGARQPLADNDDMAGRHRNRRVTVTVLK